MVHPFVTQFVVYNGTLNLITDRQKGVEKTYYLPNSVKQQTSLHSTPSTTKKIITVTSMVKVIAVVQVCQFIELNSQLERHVFIPLQIVLHCGSLFVSCSCSPTTTYMVRYNIKEKSCCTVGWALF